MSIQEVRSTVKWSAIRSKATPSNLVSRDSALNAATAQDVLAKSLNKPAKLEKMNAKGKGKSSLPPKLHGSLQFAGSTGSSRV